MTLQNHLESLLVFAGFSATQAVDIYCEASQKYPELEELDWIMCCPRDVDKMYRFILGVVFQAAFDWTDHHAEKHPARHSIWLRTHTT